jgi:hypothetical protein
LDVMFKLVDSERYIADISDPHQRASIGFLAFELALLIVICRAE